MKPCNQYVATIGMFDGVHRGHQALIDYVKRYALRVRMHPMIVTFQPHPMSVICPEKAPKLLTGYTTRKRLLVHYLGPKNKIVELAFNDELRHKTAEEFMRMLHDEYNVKVLVMGYNHSFGSDCIKDFEMYRAIGSLVGVEVLHGEQKTVESVDVKVSSSSIRKALCDGDIATANKLLGRMYALQGKVVAGRRVGRTLGFPTANLEVDKLRLVPAPGVYAAIAKIEDTAYRAMVNIGTCPTVTDGATQTIEANIIGWSGNLYNHKLTLEFVARLRSEQQFDSLEALMQQLQADKESVIAKINIL